MATDRDRAPVDEYLRLKEAHSAEHTRLKKRYHLISNLRGLLALGFAVGAYFYFDQGGSKWFIALFLIVIGFIILMKIHDSIAWRMEMSSTLISINDDELEHLRNGKLPFADGAEFIDPGHAYSYDLDIFGKDSLYQYLNRTATYIGGRTLAARLLTKLPNERIITEQEAVKELKGKLAFRQELLALARIAKDNQDDHEGLLRWSRSVVIGIPVLVNILAYVAPFSLGVMLIFYAINDQVVFLKLAGGIFLFNLLIFSTQLKRIKAEMASSDRMHQAIKHYSSIIARIEREEFESTRLVQLKGELTNRSGMVSDQVEKLSKLFANMDSMHSGIGAILFNGSLLFHIHNLRALLKWKREFAGHIAQWLDVIGEFEAIGSLANFAYNEPSFAFPKLNDRFEISMMNAGHPLIRSEKRVSNDVTFDGFRFIILSGSNMAGKSTFLRTLGVNMVLGGTGAPVCASEASIHPLKVFVSMRSSDSLSEGESYFFAEVKRLHGIMERLEGEVCFVLLDEILRGTNSDDKRSGTIEVIKKIIQKKAIGAIATHDLEVCGTTAGYPGILANKCFEVEVIDDDLHFDYMLRDGISQNKSATFLMKKMGII